MNHPGRSHDWRAGRCALCGDTYTVPLSQEDKIARWMRSAARRAFTLPRGATYSPGDWARAERAFRNVAYTYPAYPRLFGAAAAAFDAAMRAELERARARYRVVAPAPAPTQYGALGSTIPPDGS